MPPHGHIVVHCGVWYLLSRDFEGKVIDEKKNVNRAAASAVLLISGCSAQDGDNGDRQIRSRSPQAARPGGAGEIPVDVVVTEEDVCGPDQ